LDIADARAVAEDQYVYAAALQEVEPILGLHPYQDEASQIQAARQSRDRPVFLRAR
jgi:hypothetical protein